MDLPTLVRRLSRGLQRPLPGVPAQLRMAPRPRPGWDPGILPDDARAAAGLLLFFPSGDRAELLLTLRPRQLPQHGGQVSLPGGAIEAGESAVAAALREAHEEVGVGPETITVLGALTSLHIPVSRYVLHPVIGVVQSRPPWSLSPTEVERVLEVSVDHLVSPDTLSVEQRKRRDTVFEVPFFAVDGQRVWGATAMVLSELLCVLGHPPRPWGEERG